MKYEILRYGGRSVLNGLTCQEFLHTPRPILSSVSSNLTNYTVRVFLEKQKVSYQVKISPQLWNPNIHYSNPKIPLFDPLLNYFSLSYILMPHFRRISNNILWCTSRFSMQYLTFIYFIYNYLLPVWVISHLTCFDRRSQWPRGLRRRSAAARLLGFWIRIPPGAWMSVCCECCVLSGRGLCDELVTRPEESYRLWCVVVCDLETSWMRRPWPTGGCRAKNKQTCFDR